MRAEVGVDCKRETGGVAQNYGQNPVLRPPKPLNSAGSCIVMVPKTASSLKITKPDWLGGLCCFPGLPYFCARNGID